MSHFDRRRFLQTTAGLVAATGAGSLLGDLCYGQQPAAKSDRFRIGAIGVGGRGRAIMHNAAKFGDVLAVCDVDQRHAEQAVSELQSRNKYEHKVDIYEDYRKLLDRNDIDFVTIGTPDHWHTLPCIAALQSGKHVYCEKPLTLTVAEGAALLKVKEQYPQLVVQVGTQQRSEMGLRFLRAVATVRSGRLGKLQKVTVSLPLSTQTGGPFPAQDPPPQLNWDFWLGQAPLVDYCPQRCHFTFRWWFEYSGGIVTDWGAHHMDITQWALGADGPQTVDGSKTEMPNIPGGYNTPKHPVIDLVYPGDVLVQIVSGNEGILIEGDEGRIYVNRGRITGKPIEEQDADKSVMEGIVKLMDELYASGKPGDHMGNFIHCIRTGQKPVSDMLSQVRSVNACHVANISCRLGRKLTWDARQERFVGDDEANAMLSRTQREPYTIRTA